MVGRLVVGVDADGLLHVAGPRRRRPVASLSFGLDAMGLLVPGCQPVRLPWASYGDIGDPLDQAPVRDGWMVVPWAYGRAGPFGIGVRVSGRLETVSLDVLSATLNWWRRLNAAGSSLTGRSVPLCPATTALSPMWAEQDTLVALCRVLVDHPHVRVRLLDHAIVARVAVDLARGWRRTVAPPESLQRDVADMHHALQQSGFVHRYGRPLTRREVAPLDVVMEVARHRMESNPYRHGRGIDDDELDRVCRSAYCDIEPWPFHALFDTDL